jgi:MOSC domain-containing protein YiiM
MVKRFLASGRTGFYLAVIREGAVAAEDEIAFLSREPNSVPVAQITRLYVAKKYNADDVDLARRTLSIAALPDNWKDYFGERLERFKG